MQVTKENNTNAKKRMLIKILWIVYAVFSIVIWLPKFDALLTSNYEQASECVNMNDSWTVQINEQKYEQVLLDEFKFDAVNKGDQLILERIVPEELPYEDGVLRMRLKHSALRMFIDDELVYEYGFDRVAKNKSVGSGIMFIDFPGHYAGKNLRMELLVDENKAFTAFGDFSVYTWKNAIQVHLTENRLPMALGIFLLVFGFVAVVITILVVLLSPRYIRFVLIAAFSICMGIWTLCFYDILTVFTIPLYSIALIEYMALYLAPIFIIGYVYDVAKKSHNKYLMIFYWVILLLQYIFISSAITLHTLDIIHCATTLPILLILIGIAIIYIFILLSFNHIRSKNSNMQTRLYFVGVLILVIGLAIDIGLYTLERYLAINLTQYKGISSLAIIIFVVILIYIFFLDITERLMHEREREVLIHSAYHDELTEIYNRRYCSEYMEKVQEKDLIATAVLCFDVNNLKKVNDTQGHAMGDLLITDSANLINQSFSEYGVVGRMGGDEFIAILSLDDENKLTDLLNEFRNNIHKHNKSTNNFPVSIAVGTAYGKDEQVDNVEKLYQIADKRMYDNKKEMKQREKQ